MPISMPTKDTRFDTKGIGGAGGSGVGLAVSALINGLLERGGSEPLSSGLEWSIMVLVTLAFALLGAWLVPSQRQERLEQFAAGADQVAIDEVNRVRNELAEAARLTDAERAEISRDAAKLVLSAQPSPGVDANALRVDDEGDVADRSTLDADGREASRLAAQAVRAEREQEDAQAYRAAHTAGPVVAEVEEAEELTEETVVDGGPRPQA